jgi:hypothetical protein
MKGKGSIFVKLNYKNIGELNSFIYNNKELTEESYNKYVMCAGKYDKNGWTIVFKAKNINEAQQLVERNNNKRNNMNRLQNINDNKVMLPEWIQ